MKQRDLNLQKNFHPPNRNPNAGSPSLHRLQTVIVQSRPLQIQVPLHQDLGPRKEPKDDRYLQVLDRIQIQIQTLKKIDRNPREEIEEVLPVRVDQDLDLQLGEEMAGRLGEVKVGVGVIVKTTGGQTRGEEVD